MIEPLRISIQLKISEKASESRSIFLRLLSNKKMVELYKKKEINVEDYQTQKRNTEVVEERNMDSARKLI